jgi:hypothetical protein
MSKKKLFTFVSVMLFSVFFMAQSTIVIRNLPDADAVAATDEIPCDQTVTSAGGQPKSCKPSQLSTFYFGQSDKVTPNLVHTTGQTDEYCLTYEATGTTWEWQTCGSGSGDVTDVFDCATGDCNNVTIENTEYLYVAEGGTNQATDVVVVAQNATGATLYKCTAVQIYDFDAPSSLPEMRIADADAIMPATGLLLADTTNGASGKVMVAGQLTNVDTATGEVWSAGEALYVNDSGTATSADCGESLTNARPANTDDSVQKIGTVNRVNATLGKIIVSGANRSNDVPNLQDAYYWVGNGSNVATAVTMSGDATMANTGALTIAANSVDGTMIALGSDAQGDIMIYNGTNYARLAPGTNGQYLQTQGAAANPQWATVAGGSGTSPKETYWTASATLPIASSASDAVAPLTSDTGTNNDMQVASFDDSTDECRAGTFLVPSDTATGASTVTFRLKYYAATGATNSAYWDFKHNSRASGEVWDAAFTTESDGGCAPGSATQDTIAVCTWTETMTNLGWAASDQVNFELCRDADNASDNLVGDAQLIDFAVEMDRTGSTAPGDAYYQFPAGAFEMHGSNQAPLNAVDGTNQDYHVRAFDDTTDECVWFRFQLPGDFDSTGTPVARLNWHGTNIVNETVWYITHIAVADGENIDQAGTTDTSSAFTVPGTADYLSQDTWNLTDSAWAANDEVFGKLCRDANHASDDFVGDAKVVKLTISVPRS